MSDPTLSDDMAIEAMKLVVRLLRQDDRYCVGYAAITLGLLAVAEAVAR